MRARNTLDVSVMNKEVRIPVFPIIYAEILGQESSAVIDCGKSSLMRKAISYKELNQFRVRSERKHAGIGTGSMHCLFICSLQQKIAHAVAQVSRPQCRYFEPSIWVGIERKAPDW